MISLLEEKISFHSKYIGQTYTWKENKREAERQERLGRERKEKEKISKMTEEELKKYKEKEKEESIRREIESNKKFDKLFDPK